LGFGKKLGNNGLTQGNKDQTGLGEKGLRKKKPRCIWRKGHNGLSLGVLGTNPDWPTGQRNINTTEEKTYIFQGRAEADQSGSPTPWAPGQKESL